jgi:hypothetical protein
MAQPKHPRRWVEFTLEPYPSGSATVYRWSTRPLAGSVFIEGRIPLEGWERIDRRASTADGEPNIDSASILIDDRDGLIRSLLDGVTTQWFLNREGAFKLLSDAAFAAGLTPRLQFGGRCYDVQVLDERQARMEFEDVLAPYMDRQYPQYTLGDAYPFRFTEQPEIEEDLDVEDPGYQIPVALRDQVMPIYYGPFVDTAVDPITGVSRGKGMCPTFFMGYTYLTSGGATEMPEPSPEIAAIIENSPYPFPPGEGWGGWGELHVCLGEVDIPNVYTSNLGDPLKRILNTEDYGITVLAPGHAGWPFSTNYVLRNGFRCTVIFVRGPLLWHHIIGSVNITVDVCGWKNASGVPITQAGFVFQDFITQHVLANDGAGYTSGPNAGLPTFDDGRAMFWTSKIQDWQAMTADRLGNADGYLCSMALTSPRTLRDILRSFHVTFDCFSAKNAAGQLYLFSIDDLADPTAGVAVREFMELTRLPAPRLAWDEIENEIDYIVGYDPEQDTPRTPTLTVRDQPSIDALGGDRLGVRKKDTRALEFTADDATATDVIGRRLMRLKEVPTYQPLPVRIEGVDREIGEQIQVQHRDGLGAAGVGYDYDPMVIMSHVTEGHTITMEALRVGRILAVAFQPLLDESTPGLANLGDETSSAQPPTGAYELR